MIKRKTAVVFCVVVGIVALVIGVLMLAPNKKENSKENSAEETVEMTEMTFYNIPVIMNTEDLGGDLMIVSDLNPFIRLDLRGKPSVLDELRASDIIVQVDLSKITEPGTKLLPYDVTFPVDGIEILNRKPEKIEIKIAEVLVKKIPVQVEIGGMVREGFAIDEANITYTPKDVVVYGSKAAIDPIAIAKVYVNVAGANSDVEETVRVLLCDDQGKPFGDVSMVSVEGPYQVTVKIPVIPT